MGLPGSAFPEHSLSTTAGAHPTWTLSRDWPWPSPRARGTVTVSVQPRLAAPVLPPARLRPCSARLLLGRPLRCPGLGRSRFSSDGAGDRLLSPCIIVASAVSVSPGLPHLGNDYGLLLAAGTVGAGGAGVDRRKKFPALRKLTF